MKYLKSLLILPALLLAMPVMAGHASSSSQANRPSAENSDQSVYSDYYWKERQKAEEAQRQKALQNGDEVSQNEASANAKDPAYLTNNDRYVPRRPIGSHMNP
jgi:hypothetical protein